MIPANPVGERELRASACLRMSSCNTVDLLERWSIAPTPEVLVILPLCICTPCNTAVYNCSAYVGSYSFLRQHGSETKSSYYRNGDEEPCPDLKQDLAERSYLQFMPE